MSSEVRFIHESEFPDYVKTVFGAAGRPVDGAFVAERRRCTIPECAMAAFEDGKMVATVSLRPLRMRLPSGNVIPVVDIGELGALPGIGGGYSRALLMRALAVAKERGTVIAVGTAAEWPNAQLWSAGPATYAADYELDLRHVRIRSNLTAPGSCELISAEDALPLLPTLHDAGVRQGNTLIARDAAYWAVMVERLNRGQQVSFLDMSNGHPPPFFCLYRNEAGVAEGIAVYRISPAWRRGLSHTVLDLIYFVHASTAASIGMWRHLLTLSSVEKVVACHRPVDDPLRWMLVDGRRLEQVAMVDHVWLRLVDVAEALRRKGSHIPFEPFTVRVADGFMGDKTLRVSGGEGSVQVEETTAEPDVETDSGIVSALFLGGTPIRPFLETRRIVSKSARATRSFASLFITTEVPFIDTDF